MGTIKLHLRTIGTANIEVDEDEYREAKAGGELDQFLDSYFSDMDETSTVLEPDGTEFDPYHYEG